MPRSASRARQRSRTAPPSPRAPPRERACLLAATPRTHCILRTLAARAWATEVSSLSNHMAIARWHRTLTEGRYVESDSDGDSRGSGIHQRAAVADGRRHADAAAVAVPPHPGRPGVSRSTPSPQRWSGGSSTSSPAHQHSRGARTASTWRPPSDASRTGYWFSATGTTALN